MCGTERWIEKEIFFRVVTELYDATNRPSRGLERDDDDDERNDDERDDDVPSDESDARGERASPRTRIDADDDDGPTKNSHPSERERRRR